MNRKEEIRNELKEIAPFLAGLEVKSAFKVPKGYFDELPDAIFESVSPLAALSKEQAFTVPKNYFESLPDLVLERVTPKQDTEVVATPANSAPQSSWIDDLISSVAVLFQPRYALRIATVALLLTAGIFFIKNQNITTNDAIAAADIDPLEAFGLSLDDLNDEDLALLLSDESPEAEIDEFLDEDNILDELLEDLNELSDEDLEGFL